MELEEYLKAITPIEVYVKDYVLKNAGPELAQKILAGNKNIYGAIQYMKSEVRKNAKGSDMVISDAEGFAMMMKYLEDDSIPSKEKDNHSDVQVSQTPHQVNPLASENDEDEFDEECEETAEIQPVEEFNQKDDNLIKQNKKPSKKAKNGKFEQGPSLFDFLSED